ncbi:hypothetical protein SprV_0200600800 [Sparganum proliferum]
MIGAQQSQPPFAFLISTPSSTVNEQLMKQVSAVADELISLKLPLTRPTSSRSSNRRCSRSQPRTADIDSTVSTPCTSECLPIRAPVSTDTTASESAPTVAVLEHAAASSHKESPADQEVSLKPDTSEWTTITESPPMQWRWTDSRRDEERSGATDAEQSVSRRSATSKGGSGTLEGNLSGSWDTRTPMHQEACECGADCEGNEGSSGTPWTWSQLLVDNECPGMQAMNLRASTTGPMPSLPSWSLATRQSSSSVLSAPPGPPATSLTLPATQFTPSAPRPSRRPHNSVVTTSLRSQLLPTPLPPPPPAGPCCADLLTTNAPSNVLRATALQAVEGTTETIISARPISSSTQGAVAAAYITITTYITNVDIKHTDAVTTTAIILTSTPPPSPPPPLYAVDCLPVVEADSSAEYHRETSASHLPV